MAVGVSYNATQLAAAAAGDGSSGPLPGQMEGYNTALDGVRAQMALWYACNRQFNAAIGGTVVILLALLLYGGARRVQMRRKFGLPGDTCHDMCAWVFCAWAALCQEVRTLRQNGVRGGAWGGEAAVATRLLAPEAVQMAPRGASAV